VRAKVTSNQAVADGIFQLVMEQPDLARVAQPGQFLNLRVTEGTAPLLRRPISIHWVLDDQVEILYQVVGKGTEILSRVQPGALLDIQGPLGRGFQTVVSAKTLLVGGGIGIAPLGLLARELDSSATVCILGARSGEVVMASGGKKLTDLGYECKIATDDGSLGRQGLVTGLLAEELVGAGMIYACGPKAMLRTTAQLALAHNIPCQISLEEHMGCGVGACLGCVCKGVPKFGKENYRKVCSDGPVFDAREVIWE
jgi:dihydroorotate dehydrogenase electron transfer subunit